MPATRRTLDELARLGGEVFARQIRSKLRPEDDGKYVAIDVDSGEYEIDADDCAAVANLRAKKSSADLWLMRAGHKAEHSR
jgi:hypothetical protein